MLHRYQVDALLNEAVTAAEPVALHSTLSWRFSGSDIEMHSGPPAGGDPVRRATLLAGGAVLLNLRVLVRGLGVQPLVRLLPDPADLGLVATIRLEQPRSVSETDRVLVAAVLSRAGSEAGDVRRRERAGDAGASVAVPSAGALLSPLRRAVKTELAWLAVQDLPSVLASVSPDPGVPGRSGTALIVGTVLDGPAAQLQAGQAAQRAMLTAATLGADTRPLPELLRNGQNRRQIRDLIGGALWPQAILLLDGEPIRPVSAGDGAADPAVQ